MSKHQVANHKGKIAFFLVLIILVGMGTKQYKNRREFLAQDLQKIAYEVNQMEISARYTTDTKDINQEIQGTVKRLQIYNDVIYRDLNFFEKKRLKDTEYKLYISPYVSIMQEKLRYRKELGYWEDVDEEVYNRYSKKVIDLLYFIEKENFKMRGLDIDNENVEKNETISLLLSQVNADELATKYYELNELAALYVKYTELPENINIQDAGEIKSILDKIYEEMEGHKISTKNVSKLIMEDSIYRNIQITSKGHTYDIEVEAIYGRITKLRHQYQHDMKKDEMQKVYSEEEVRKVVEKIFGSHGEYKIHYMEKSKNFSSDATYYSYEILPFYNGYPLYFQHVIPEIHFSAYDFSAILFMGEQQIPTKAEMGETKIVFEKEEALKEVFNKQKEYMIKKYDSDITMESFTYEQTAYVQSFATGRYDIVHIYTYGENKNPLYIHAMTGIGE